MISGSNIKKIIRNTMPAFILFVITIFGFMLFNMLVDSNVFSGLTDDIRIVNDSIMTNTNPLHMALILLVGFPAIKVLQRIVFSILNAMGFGGKKEI